MKEIWITRTVEENGLACNMKSGSLPVLATPQMIAWMEEAACLCLELEEGMTSVGILMNVSHDAPSVLKDEIRVHAIVTEEKGRILSFSVEAFCREVCIGKGVHKRAIVQAEKFMAKANAAK